MDEALSATQASKNFSDLINKTLYMKQTTTLLRGDQPVAKVIPVSKDSVTGEDWLNLTKEIRSELKLPDIKWE